MTIREDVQLVIRAGAIGEGGETFMLDTGEPGEIVGLAGELTRLSGYTPGKDIRIVHGGTSPGNNLHEGIAVSGKPYVATRHKKICMLKETQPAIPRCSSERSSA